MQKMIIAVILFLFIVSSLFSIASEINLPRTGQTLCYDDAGTVIACTGTGQDGAIQAGIPWPSPRFTAANGAVTDNLTGLVWLQNANCTETVGSIAKGSEYLVWADALTWSNGLTSGKCGLTDGSIAGQWRLPTIMELQSLIDRSMYGPALPNGHPFNNVNAYDNYWSSSSGTGNITGTAWSIGISIGDLGSDYNYYGYYVWPVRSGLSSAPAQVPETGQTTSYASGDDGALRLGVAWPVPRFTDNGNGTATDNLTGLIWLQNANCFGAQSWANAITSSNNLASGSCGLTDGSNSADWRLPSSVELVSLVDISKETPILPNGHPFSNVKAYGDYWSSSTRNDYPESAWSVFMAVGYLTAGIKNYNIYLWPVRGGQFGNSVISVLPVSGLCGNVPIGGSSSQNMTIRNTAAAGSSKLQINAITLRGTDPGQFNVNPGNGSGGTCGSTTPILNPGASCTVSVNFSPTSVGAKSATLRVSGSDVTAPNTDISLTGSGDPSFTVTAGVSGGNGSISSANPAYVASGATASFTLAPATNYQPSGSITGTCQAGSFNGNTYTTGAVTADCTIGFSFSKITYPLTLSFAGSGGGTVSVQPNPPAIDCTGTCSQSIDSGTAVTLTATANGYSVFSGWSGCPSVSGNQCNVTMTAAKSLSAFFNLQSGGDIKANGSTYGTISGGYDNVPESGEIALKAGDYYEQLVFSKAVSYTLRGGYNSGFTAQSGSSTIHGSITISAGIVTFDGITIQ